jgi:hypothetical protein
VMKKLAGSPSFAPRVAPAQPFLACVPTLGRWRLSLLYFRICTLCFERRARPKKLRAQPVFSLLRPLTEP